MLWPEASYLTSPCLRNVNETNATYLIDLIGTHIKCHMQRCLKKRARAIQMKYFKTHTTVNMPRGNRSGHVVSSYSRWAQCSTDAWSQLRSCPCEASIIFQVRNSRRREVGKLAQRPLESAGAGFKSKWASRVHPEVCQFGSLSLLTALHLDTLSFAPLILLRREPAVRSWPSHEKILKCKVMIFHTSVYWIYWFQDRSVK